MSALAIIAGAGALYGGVSANQASQKAKGQLGAQQNQSVQNYAALQPYRDASGMVLNNAINPQALSREFVDPANPYAQGGSGQFTPITTGSGAYAGQVSDAANKLATAPTPTQLAQSEFQQLLDQSKPALALADQKVGQDAAKFGTLGAGRTTSQLGDVQTVNERNLLNASQTLANTAGSQTLQDYLNQLSAMQGLNQNDLALKTQQQGVNIGLGAQAVGFNQAAQNQNYNQAMGLGNFGYNPAQQPNYAPLANYYGNQAASEAAGANSAAGALGTILSNKNTQQTAPTRGAAY